MLLNDDLDMSNEQSTTNRTQLLAEARLSCQVAGESETLFSGRVWLVEPKDYGFTLICQDWLALINECECEVSLAPDETSAGASAEEKGTATCRCRAGRSALLRSALKRLALRKSRSPAAYRVSSS